MVNQVFLSVLLFLGILKFGNGYYYHSGTTERMKMKVIYMDHELIKVALRNIQRIDYIKQFYTISPIYDIGQMLYFIRSKFARMMRVFVLALENDNDESFFTYHLHLPAMKEIQYLTLEIYHLIEMLEEYEMNSHKELPEIKVIKPGEKYRKPTPNPFSKGRGLRQRPINIPSFSKKGFYARKPNQAGRSGIMVNRTIDLGSAFESDIE